MDMKRQAGRRARQVGYVLVPVKEEVAKPIQNACAGCDGRTSAKPDQDGKRWCLKCRPCERVGKQPKGTAKRLCIRCDRTIYRSPKLNGPFFCIACKRNAGRQDARHYHEAGGARPKSVALSPEMAARCDRLAEMYARVKEFGTEGEARAAGLPTTSEQVPWSVANGNQVEGDGGSDGEESG